MSKISKKFLDFDVYEQSEITTISGDIVAQIPSDFYTQSEITTWRNGTTQTEMGYVHGVTSDIQTQLDGKLKIDGTTSITGNWNVDGADTLYVDKTNGRVGIVTASPGYALEVVGTISGTDGLFKNTYVGEVGTGFAGFCYEGNDNYNDYALLQGNDGTTYINAVDLKNITLRINNSEKMQVLSTGVRVSSGVFVLPNGTSINEFSIDGTLADDSDDAVPTEKAVKTYSDAHINNTSNPHSVDETDVLPSQTGNSGKYLTTNGTNSSWATVSGGASLPVGTVIAHSTGVPTGYLHCDGSNVSRTTYSNLFSILGVMYGSGDGSTTFTLPDYRGWFLRAWANGSTLDPDRASRGDRGDGTTGDNIGTKQGSQYMSHNHSYNDIAVPGSWYTAGGGSYGVGSTGNSGGNETRPSNIYVIYCIKY